jgi:hypothetical protein
MQIVEMLDEIVELRRSSDEPCCGVGVTRRWCKEE